MTRIPVISSVHTFPLAQLRLGLHRVVAISSLHIITGVRLWNTTNNPVRQLTFSPMQAGRTASSYPARLSMFLTTQPERSASTTPPPACRVNASLVSGLSKPYSVAVQGNDLLVADAGNNRIGEYNATTGQALNVSFISGLEYPTGLAISGTTLFVAAPTTGVSAMVSGSKIGSYDLATGNANNVGAYYRSAQGVYSIAALAGDILVPNFSNNTLSEYDGTSGALINGNFVTGLERCRLASRSKTRPSLGRPA